MPSARSRWLAVVFLLTTLGSMAHAQPPDEAPDERADEPLETPTEPESAFDDEREEGRESEPPALSEEEATAPTPADVAPHEPATLESCAGDAWRVAADSVVRVRSGRHWGAGFVYGSPRHVVTAFRLVARGRGVTLVTRDGTHVEARVVAHDKAYDLAILETAEPVPDAEPLEAAPASHAQIGLPVVALGHPFAGFAFFLGRRGEGLLRWSVAEGTIGAVNEEGIQADLALTPGHAGGPLLDCEGRVLGMITGAGMLSPDLGLVARIGRIDVLLERVDPASDFLGGLRLQLGFGGLLSVDDDGRVAGGGVLSAGLVLFDRLSWVNRFGLLWGGTNDDPTADVLSLERRLFRFESLLGWRFFVDVGGFTTLYLVPAAGLTVTHEKLESRTVRVVEGCTPSETESCIAIEEAEVGEWHVRPAIGITFIVGTFELGYTFELDVSDPITTHHTFILGAVF